MMGARVTGSFLVDQLMLVDRPHGCTGVVFCTSWRQADRLIDEACIALGLSGVRYSSDSAGGRYLIMFGKNSIRFKAICHDDACHAAVFYAYSGCDFEWVWDLVGVNGSGRNYMNCRLRCRHRLDVHWNGEVVSNEE